MPFLEVDGKIIGQSLAIARYVAREHGLMPSGNFQQALVEQIIDTVTDFRLEIFKAVFESNASRKEEMMKKVNNETIPKYLGILEEILKSNMGGEKFFIGESVTLADICVFDGLNIPLEKKLISLEKHPLLDDHYTRIESLPKIAEWLEKRPKSEY